MSCSLTHAQHSPHTASCARLIGRHTQAAYATRRAPVGHPSLCFSFASAAVTPHSPAPRFAPRLACQFPVTWPERGTHCPTGNRAGNKSADPAAVLRTLSCGLRRAGRGGEAFLAFALSLARLNCAPASRAIQAFQQPISHGRRQSARAAAPLQVGKFVPPFSPRPVAHVAAESRRAPCHCQAEGNTWMPINPRPWRPTPAPPNARPAILHENVTRFGRVFRPRLVRSPRDRIGCRARPRWHRCSKPHPITRPHRAIADVAPGCRENAVHALH